MICEIITKEHTRKKNKLLIMAWKVLIHLFLLATLVCLCAGKLRVKPRDTDAKINHLTYFNCSTDLVSSDIFWNHGTNYIYTGNVILEPYNERFKTESYTLNGTFSNNLIIQSVQPGDAGEYICADDEGIGEKYSGQLVVLDGDPICRSNIELDKVIGQNTCNVEPDEVELSCRVTYHGNIHPQLEWKRVGDDRRISEGLSDVISANHYNYILKLKGDISLNRSSYVCQATRIAHEPRTCITEAINVLYALSDNSTTNGRIDDEITCHANTTQSCNYKWRWFDDNDVTTESSSAILKPRKKGLHQCEAECYLRNETCNLLVMQALVSESAELIQTRTAVIPVVVVIVVAVLVLVVAVIYVWRRRMKKGAQMIFGHRRMLEYLLLQKVLCKANISEEMQDEVFEEEIQLLYTINKTREYSMEEVITGVAILTERVFIVRELGLFLEVYDFNNFNLGCQLVKLKGFGEAGNMCSCRKNHCLYILNNKISRLEVMKFSTGGKLLRNWLTNDGAESLSATADGNVITTVQDEHMLLEYMSDGKLLRQLVLPDNISPWHAVKRDDQYIVSYGTLSDPLHGVCLVDQDGNVQKSFGRGTGSAEGQLNTPCYLAVTSSGCVIVSDLFNSRLILLDSNLEFKAKIVPKYKQRYLFAGNVVLDEQRLVLAVNSGDPVEIFPLKEDTREETVESHNSVESYQLLRKSKAWKIEEDSRVLVFDIRPLLQKYNDRA